MEETGTIMWGYWYSPERLVGQDLAAELLDGAAELLDGGAEAAGLLELLAMVLAGAELFGAELMAGLELLGAGA